MTVLVACSHGTTDPVGTAAVSALVDAVRARGLVDVREAHVDVHGPFVADVVADVQGDVVVVPLLLAAGFHTRVEIAEAVAPWPSARQADALGPDDRLTAMLLDRLAAAGVQRDDAVMLAAAGSSDDRADVSVRAAADSLARSWGAPVVVGYGAAREPRMADQAEALRAAHPGRRVVAASYLLAAGHFQRRLDRCGADLVTAPLLGGGPVDARLVDLVLDRFTAAADGRTGL